MKQIFYFRLMYFKLESYDFLNNLSEQKINQKDILLALQKCYQNCAFSTFPYIIKNKNSVDSLKKYNSGNCVALSLYLKFLLKEMGINSYLIPATIPESFSFKNFLRVSHVALAIPKNKSKIYIADPAFYFINPIKFIYPSKKENYIYSKNIYINEHNSDPKDYKSINKIYYSNYKSKNEMKFNKYQIIPENTYYTECYLDSNTNDKWKYFLIEVKNPDKAISNFFCNIKNRPLIISTTLDKNGICSAYYDIRIKKDFLVVKYKNNTIKKIFFEEIKNNPTYFKNFILKELDLGKFFDSEMLEGIVDYVNEESKYRNNLLISD